MANLGVLPKGLLLFGDGERRRVRVRRGAKTGAGKQQVLMDPLVGAPIGANFRLEPSGLERGVRSMRAGERAHRGKPEFSRPRSRDVSCM